MLLTSLIWMIFWRFLLYREVLISHTSISRNSDRIRMLVRDVRASLKYAEYIQLHENTKNWKSICFSNFTTNPLQREIYLKIKYSKFWVTRWIFSIALTMAILFTWLQSLKKEVDWERSNEERCASSELSTDYRLPPDPVSLFSVWLFYFIIHLYSRYCIIIIYLDIILIALYCPILLTAFMHSSRFLVGKDIPVKAWKNCCLKTVWGYGD